MDERRRYEGVDIVRRRCRLRPDQRLYGRRRSTTATCDQIDGGR